MNYRATNSHTPQPPRPALPGTQAWFAAEQVSGVQSRVRQTQPWFSILAMSCEPEHLTNTSQSLVSFDNLTIKRWAPMVRVVYDYYPFGLSWEKPKLPNDPEGVHDHAYQDKEFQFAEFSTGHGLALYDFHARMYDPATGRWLVPDPAEQFSNPYLAMANNPVSYVDPDGEFVIAPVLVAMAYGALIGAGTSAAIYSVQAGINGSWNWNDFGKTAAIGAVGGALGGGLGNVGAQLAQGGMAFGQSLGYNVLSNVASNSATTLAFGGDITAGGVVGMAVGGAIGSGIGNFQGVSGSAMKNIGAELGFGAFKGAVTGAYSGMIGAAIDGTDPRQGFINGARNGAIAGATLAGLNIATMGAAYKPEREYGDFGNESPVYRKGTLITRYLFNGSGVTIGRNLVVNKLNPNKAWQDENGRIDSALYGQFVEAHETAHFKQQRDMGFANFYGRTAREYFISPGFRVVYNTPGTLEWQADIYGRLFVPNYYQ